MKTDARIKYTKKVIRETFLKLLGEKSVNDITVKEVCELAEINRATFYKYYDDCYDLMDKICREMLDDYDKSLSTVNFFDIKMVTDSVFNVIDKNSDLCNLLIFQRKEDLIIRKMVDIAHDKVINLWKQKMINHSSDRIEMLFSFLANGMVQVILSYYGKYDRNVITDFIIRTIQLTLMTYL